MKVARSLLFVMLAATAALSQTATPEADARQHKPPITSSSKSLSSGHASESVASEPPAKAAPATDASKRKNGAVIAADFPKNAAAKSSLDGASKDAAKSATVTETRPRDVASGQASGKRETVTGQATGKATPRDTASGQASGK